MLTNAKTYAMKQAEELNKITMIEFFNYIHSTYYSDQDISFMEYFLELTEHEGEFIVHHEKLIEYGIMTSTESSKVREKMKTLDLEKDIDFLLADVREPLKGQRGGATSGKKVYMLTPEAFKKCLMRAQRRPDQPVDPMIYCKYYLLLEKVYKLYTDYERAYANKLISTKDQQLESKDLQIESLQDKYEKEYQFRIDHIAKSCTQYLYIASTEMYSSKNIFKIGKTNNIKERMQNYSTGYLNNEKLKVHKYIKVAHSQSLERYVFEYLKPYQQEEKEMFKVEYKILDNLFNKIETFEHHMVDSFNCIIKDDLQNPDVSKLIKALETTTVPTNQITELKIDSPLRSQKMTSDSATNALKEIGIELLSDFVNPNANHRYRCLSIFQHEFECTYNNLMKYKGRGCKYCTKDCILDKIKIYRYNQDTLKLDEVFNEWNDLQTHADYSQGQSQMIKKNIRSGNWTNVCINYIHTFISPNEYNALDYNKQLNECETKIIELLELPNAIQKHPIYKAYCQEKNIRLFGLTKTNLAEQINDAKLVLVNVNRGTIRRYLLKNKSFNGIEIYI